jgi:hypothetical protein
MSNEHIKRCSQDAKSMDIHPIEIQEAKECLNFFQDHGSFSVLYTLNFDWVHGNEILADNESEVFHLCCFKLAFLGF